MSIQTQIDRIKQAKADLVSQIEAKGVTVPDDASLDDLAALVEAISTGVELPELSNPATESEIFLGKETIDALGGKVIGTFTVTPEITAQDALIADILTALDGKAAGGGGGSVETCTVEFKSTSVIAPVPPTLRSYIVSRLVSGSVVSEWVQDVNSSGIHTVSDVVCGSVVIIAQTSDLSAIPANKMINCEVITTVIEPKSPVIRITAGNGETATIVLQ